MARPSKPPRLVRIPNREFWYIADGRQRHSTKTTDEEAAQCFLAEYIVLKETPLDPTISKLLDMRLADLVAAKKARVETTPGFHKALKKHFGNLQPHQVTQAHINAYRKKRQDVPAALREELMELKTSLKFAKRDGLIETVPHIELPARRPPREKFLTREQGRAILDAARPLHLRVYLLIAMTTGARKGAILGLTWERVNFERGRIDFTDPELALTKKRRTVVPILPDLVAALRTAQDMAQTPYVIEYMGRPIKDIRRTFKDAAVSAGLPWACPHVLKHSVISWLTEDGFSVDQISDLTATNPETVRRIYRHFSPDYLEEVAVSLGKTVSFTNQFAKLSKDRSEKIQKNRQ